MVPTWTALRHWRPVARFILDLPNLINGGGDSLFPVFELAIHNPKK